LAAKALVLRAGARRSNMREERAERTRGRKVGHGDECEAPATGGQYVLWVGPMTVEQQVVVPGFHRTVGEIFTV